MTKHKKCVNELLLSPKYILSTHHRRHLYRKNCESISYGDKIAIWFLFLPSRFLLTIVIPYVVPLTVITFIFQLLLLLFKISRSVINDWLQFGTQKLRAKVRQIFSAFGDKCHLNLWLFHVPQPGRDRRRSPCCHYVYFTNIVIIIIYIFFVRRWMIDYNSMKRTLSHSSTNEIR